MINLGSWMNGILISWGVDPKNCKILFDENDYCSIAGHTGDRTGLPVPGDLCRQYEKTGTTYALSMGFVASQT